MWVYGDNCLDDKTKCVRTKYTPFKLCCASGDETGKMVTGVDVQITDKIAVMNQLFGAAGDVREDYEGVDGVMGLKMDLSHGVPSVIYNIIAQKLITEPAYSLCVKGQRLL
ncbi:hypothetical protein LOD99_7386 [Oopsacas minuta]|uniref:Peptidase A1 domain-containing protein n=1 Tax=Oopsacas minuta TaxID=111878 RepID=A0AAV7JU95_9METZ|nr:hypothetical protein LOD99_7386 [Oopsacas minuta]